MKSAGFYVLLAFFAMPSVLQAADERAGERRQPLQELIRTEVVYPQEEGELQLTIGSRFDKGRASDSLAFPIGLEYGITDAWQVGLEWTALARVGAPGHADGASGDFAVATKYSFISIGGSRLHAAVGVEAGFPRRIEAQGERGREVEPHAAFAADVNRRGAQVFGHVGLAFASADDGEGGVEKELQWNAGALIPMASMTVATELNVRNDRFTVRGARELYITPSITFRPRRFWEVAAGVPLGVTSESPRAGLTVLVSFER